MLVSASALFALCSMDMGYFEGLCLNAEGKTSALKALSLLWESGENAEIISNPVNSSMVLPGGIIGGAIAVALFEVIGNVIGILTIIVFLLTQVKFIILSSVIRLRSSMILTIRSIPVTDTRTLHQEDRDRIRELQSLLMAKTA